MKYQLKNTEILANSVTFNTSAGTSTFAAIITFEVLPEISGHTIPDSYKLMTLTFYDLDFPSLDMGVIVSEKETKGLSKLKEIYGDDNVII